MTEPSDENSHLLWELLDELGAVDRGNVCGFHDTAHDWRCPCCFRSKREIARIDKNRNLWCAIVFHHDHYQDLAYELFSKYKLLQTRTAHVVLGSFARFPETLICEDCNNADAAAKAKINAAMGDEAQVPATFSFAPHEIAHFVRVSRNTSHEIVTPRAVEAWRAIAPSMRLLKDRLKETIKAASGAAEFEAVGEAAARVLMNIAVERMENPE